MGGYGYRARRPDRNQVQMRILFITYTRVGDAVLSTGLLAELLRRYPGAEVTIACGPVAAPLFEGVPGLERIIVMEKKPLSLHWLGLLAACGTRVWDVVVNLRRNPLMRLIPHMQYFAADKAGETEHRLDYLARVMALDPPPLPTLWTLARHEDTAEKIIPTKGRVLALAPTSNWRAKTWPAENFAELAKKLTAAKGILPNARIAVFAHASEEAMARPVIEALPKSSVIDLVGDLDLLSVYACLKRCDFYVGNDSGLMHVAAAAGIPTLGLFGPTREERYGPRGETSASVRTKTPFEKIIPENFNHRTSPSLMTSLSVERAEKAARELWRRVKKEAA